jgi:uncharacterized protein
MRAVDAVRVVDAARAGLVTLCNEAAIPESHGCTHAENVLAHADGALACADLPPTRALAVRLAALLHDADDRKYFPDSSAYPNARRIMADAGAEAGVIEEAVKMIGWVSCSANGNSCPEEANQEPEWLWPRWADRLEAVGSVGIVRCYQYNSEKGDPLSSPATPRPATEDEVFALAMPERFAKYQASSGGSVSMMDHYYGELHYTTAPALHPTLT